MRFDPLSPIFLHFFAYCLFIFIPPLFTKESYHITAIYYDILGLSIFCISVFCGYSLKTLMLGRLIFTIKQSNKILILLTFVFIIFSVRFYLYSKYDIFAFLHPFSRPSSLIDTFHLILVWPYIIFLMTMFKLTKNKMYFLLILIEIILFVIPTMARSYYIFFIGYLAIVVYFYDNLSFIKIVKKFGLPFIVVVLFLIAFANYVNAVRSVVTVGDINTALSLKVDNYIDNSALLKRINMHREVFSFEPVIKDIVKLDETAWMSMIEKWFLGADKYEQNPTGVSNEAGKLIGYGSKTSTDIPRNFILGQYGIGILIIYNFLWGVTLGFFYKLIYARTNILFVSLWSAFIFAQSFSALGATPSAHFFQLVFSTCSWVVFFSFFYFLKISRSVLQLGVKN